LGIATEREQLLSFLCANAAPILAAAARERDALQEYLRGEGLCDENCRPAVVDLGHNASLQASLAKLVDRPTLPGYYFATFMGARQRYLAGLPIESYLIEFEHSQLSDHVYCRNVGLFEFLFLPQQASFVRMERDPTGVPRPVFVVGDESKRARVVEDMHRGILDFCNDMLRATGGRPGLFDISKTEALRAFSKYADEPERPDAAIMDGVSFVDSFAGLSARYLIASPLFASLNPLNYPAFYNASWWKPGARAMAGRLARFDVNAATPAWERKLRKLLRDPVSFVVDTPLSRKLRKLLGIRSIAAR